MKDAIRRVVQKPRDPFEFFFLSALAGLFFFRLFLQMAAPETQTKSSDFNFYILGWLLFPALGLGAGLWGEGLRRRWFSKARYFYSAVLFLNFFLLLFALLPARWERRDVWQLGLAFILTQVLSPYLAAGLEKWKGAERRLPFIMGWGGLLWGLLLFLTLKFDTFQAQARGGHLLRDAGFGLALILLFVSVPIFRRTWPFPLKTKGVPLLYGAAAVVIFICVINPAFTSNFEHYSFYLGPLADLMNGKSLLVDINAQYGVGIFYFLLPFFHILPLGFTSFCLVYTGLLMLQYFLFFWIARQMMSAEMAVAALGMFLVLNCFHITGFVTEYPSIGPLRFGFIYLLLTCLLFRNKRPADRRIFLILEGLLVSAAFWWSFEVCVYTVPAYLLLIFYEELAGPSAASWRLRLGVILAGILTGGALLYTDVWRRTGDWPHWSHYFNYIFYYKDGFGMILLPPWGLWWILAGIFYFSLFAVAALGLWGAKSPPANLNAAAFLGFSGVTQFFYYLGRSDPNNLWNIAAPSLLLFFYWTDYLRLKRPSAVPGGFRKTALALAAGAVLFGLFAVFPDAQWKLHKTFDELPELPMNLVKAFQDKPRFDAFAQDAKRLMDRYSPGDRFPVYFFGNQDLSISMYDRKSKRYPFNDPIQADFCPAVSQSIRAFDPSLQKGDCVYLSQDLFHAKYLSYPLGRPKMVNSQIEQNLLEQLGARYQYHLIDQENGISVYRVMGLKSGG